MGIVESSIFSQVSRSEKLQSRAKKEGDIDRGTRRVLKNY